MEVHLSELFRYLRTKTYCSKIQGRNWQVKETILCLPISFSPIVVKENSVQKLLATSTLRRQSGRVNKKLKFVSAHWRVKFKQDWSKVMLTVKLLMVLFVQSHLVWYLEVISKLIKDLTLNRLRNILCSHNGAKNTSEHYQMLASLSQSPKESPQVFLMNALDLG